jgi:hypothetical protein
VPHDDERRVAFRQVVFVRGPVRPRARLERDRVLQCLGELARLDHRQNRANPTNGVIDPPPVTVPVTHR